MSPLMLERQRFIPHLTPSSEILHALARELDDQVALERMDALATLKTMMIQTMEQGAIGLILELCPENNRDTLSVAHIHAISPLLGQLFGELLVQNEAGDKVIAVYDRDRYASMFQGARYHQTREGGSIHTDNVNIPTPWDYLILTCLAPAYVGAKMSKERLTFVIISNDGRLIEGIGDPSHFPIKILRQCF